jgi:hypothetical protein
MSVTVDRDCVTMEDGKLLCWDGDDKCYYVLSKKRVETDELSSKDITKLVDHISGQRRCNQ